MKNKLINLNDHLFAQLELLADPDIKDNKLDEEIKRSKSMCSIANTIINNANLALKAHMAINDGLIDTAPAMIGMRKKDEKN